MKIEDYNRATPLIQKIQEVSKVVEQGRKLGASLSINVISENGHKTVATMSFDKVEEFIGIGLWNLIVGYEKYLKDKLEKL